MCAHIAEQSTFASFCWCYVFSITFEPRPHLLPAAGVNPYAAHIYYNRGNLYKALGQYEEAEEDYRQGEY